LERSRAELDSPAGEAFRQLLDRMISNTRTLFPTVSDLARELRYRCCDEPLFREARSRIYADASETLDYLAAHPKASDAYEKTRSLIECPQPLAGLFSSRFASAKQSLQRLMLEVMTSRYYNARKLHNLHPVTFDGRWC